MIAPLTIQNYLGVIYDVPYTPDERLEHPHLVSFCHLSNIMQKINFVDKQLN